MIQIQQGFCGEYWDAETNTYYLRARYYAPFTGRFISADTHWNLSNMIYGDSWNTGTPKISWEAIMQSGNLYLYCINDPVNFIDPTGLTRGHDRKLAQGPSHDKARIDGREAFIEVLEFVPVAHYLQAAVGYDLNGNKLDSDQRVEKLNTGLELSRDALESAYIYGGCRGGGVRIINKGYADKTFNLSGDLAKTYPNGVKFNSNGFPDFSPYSIKNVTVKDLQGNRTSDFTKANKAAGFSSTPIGYTWHHVEDGFTMLLVPTTLHRAVRHTGGVALINNGTVPR